MKVRVLLFSVTSSDPSKVMDVPAVLLQTVAETPVLRVCGSLKSTSRMVSGKGGIP